MNAYKFLQAGSVGRFSGRAWPRPHAWVSAESGIDLCSSGDLSYWLDDELWRVELAGVTEAEHLVVATRVSAAVTAGHLDPAGGPTRERELQAAWLVDELSL